jgi:hypothetical protein
MAIKDAFTAGEWQTVGAAPFLVGMYLVGVTPGRPILIVRGVLSTEKAVALEAIRSDGLPLIKEINGDLRADVLRRDLGRISTAAGDPAKVLAELGRALTLVRARAPAMDSAFRAWLYRLAEKLARGMPDSGAHRPARAAGARQEAALAALAELLGVPP